MSGTATPNSSLYLTANEAMGGDLAAFLRDGRAKGLSFHSLSAELRTKGVFVTYETVRAWCSRLEEAS